MAVHHVSRSAQQATRTTYFLDEPCLFAAAGDFDVVDVRFGRFGTLRGKINRKQYSSGWGRLFSVYWCTGVSEGMLYFLFPRASAG